ncbi:IroE protein [Durotheca rogersii]|uniref:IroE protein n=1 Tax=Durotheca rogersii TaxID=419775 RepID=UPI00222043A7|nr:IroE protein [Durotheca rogersii]KAI5865562.1 IroE protein [Durotheca rogersii]
MLNKANRTQIPSAEEWTVKNERGREYVIQIGFPRDWATYEPVAGDSLVPVLYLTDGNSAFLTALDALHRRLCKRDPSFTSGIIVGIGYPLPADSQPVFDRERRQWDLTPPASPGSSSPEGGGGADEFLDFVCDRVRPFVRQRLAATTRGADVSVGREALYGHSFGGLFCLHALFTRPQAFACFVASSPSIWWDGERVLAEEAAFLRRQGEGEEGQGLEESGEGNADADADLEGRNRRKPSLMLFVGGEEEDPPRRRGESEEAYRKRQARHETQRMVTNVETMHRRLRASGRFEHLSCRVYEGEDHGSVIACSLSRGLTTFFENWPLEV